MQHANLPSSRSPRQASTCRSLRVFTYNAFECRRGIEPLRALLQQLDPDIICLQELILSSTIRREFNQAAWLAEVLDKHVISVSTCRGFRRNVGSAVLTRRPLEAMEVLIDGRGERYGIAGFVRIGEEQVALVAGHYARVTRPLPVGVLLSSIDRLPQLRRSCRWIKKTRRPGIIAGDFNALPFTADYTTIARHMTDCSRAVPVNHRATRPTWGLPVQLDYVFVTRDIRVSGCGTLDYAGSDHRPVLADLVLFRDAGPL